MVLELASKFIEIVTLYHIEVNFIHLPLYETYVKVFATL